MGRMIERHKSEDKWRVWSTWTDSWLTDWITEEEVKQYIFEEERFEYEKEVIRKLWSFPEGWVQKSTDRILSGPYEEFYQWLLPLYDDPGTYRQKIHEKFVELTEGHAS